MTKSQLMYINQRRKLLSSRDVTKLKKVYGKILNNVNAAKNPIGQRSFGRCFWLLTYSKTGT